MRLLIVHNDYQQLGGETLAMKAERNLLESHGHETRLLGADNSLITTCKEKLRASLSAFYSSSSRARTLSALNEFRPDVVHVHNLFPLLSASVLSACTEADVPVVQTLHNYRLLCPNALLFRKGKVCEDCIGKLLAWPSVGHACYRGSSLATCVVAAATAWHRALKSYEKAVLRYIALTEFSRAKFVQGGLPPEQISVKPHFLDSDPGQGTGAGRYALYVGRLSQEKGIHILLKAWRLVTSGVALKIIGSGPLADDVLHAADGDARIQYLGPKSPHQLYHYMGEASVLVFPSICHETFGRSMIEAFAKGTPVIASRLGSMQEIVSHQRTGLHFAPGDPEGLAQQVEWVLTHPSELQQMRREARAEFESKYTAERNYSMLMEIYERAMRRYLE